MYRRVVGYWVLGREVYEYHLHTHDATYRLELVHVLWPGKLWSVSCQLCLAIPCEHWVPTAPSWDTCNGRNCWAWVYPVPGSSSPPSMFTAVYVQIARPDSHPSSPAFGGWGAPQEIGSVFTCAIKTACNPPTRRCSFGRWGGKRDPFKGGSCEPWKRAMCRGQGSV